MFTKFTILELIVALDKKLSDLAASVANKHSFETDVGN